MPRKAGLRINTWTTFISSNCRAKALTQLSMRSQPVNKSKLKHPTQPLISVFGSTLIRL